ncbi:MAG: L,D-transpeptidase scaffold domain-containing protein, partial [Mucilaginibacter sp.]
MKKMIKIVSRLETSMLLILLISSLTLYFSIHALAANSAPGFKSGFAPKADTSFSPAITSQLTETKKKLYFPASVERFYKQQGFKLIWVAQDNVKTHAPEAMLLLDCVLQYGLSHSDYHPQELLYDKLRTITERYSSVSDNEKARFDIMLTDAMIAFMNNLHFGKLNPDFPASRIDAGKAGDLKAELVLANAIRQKDFMSIVLNTQPKSKEYIDLQNHMHLYTGQYLDDCYQVPEGDIKIMAINLERLRWAGLGGSSYVHINIPSYTLKLHQQDSIYQFKVVVGKPANPSPTLQSAISYFMTAPDWRVPQKIFVKELLPKALANKKYIENSHFAIFDLYGNYINPT